MRIKNFNISDVTKFKWDDLNLVIYSLLFIFSLLFFFLFYYENNPLLFFSGMVLFVSFLLNLFFIDRFKSNQKQYEESKINTAHLERIVGLADLAGGLAHEINNPLAIILGKLQNLKLKMRNEKVTEEVLQTAFEKIEHAAKRAQKVVNGLKMLTRDTSKDQPVLASIGSIIEDMNGFWRERLINYEIELILEPKYPNIQVLCKPLQLVLVFLNLISNSFQAIKFIDGPKWIRIVVNEDLNNVIIKVIDSGKGIPIEVQKKIFDPFFTTRGPDEGIGLGLSIAASIIKAHRGSLILDPKDENTCFIVTLPKRGGS